MLRWTEDKILLTSKSFGGNFIKFVQQAVEHTRVSEKDWHLLRNIVQSKGGRVLNIDKT